ncbi:MAG: hypothetical protein ACYTFK_13525, partial [Planctomycetota bacterium]
MKKDKTIRIKQDEDIGFMEPGRKLFVFLFLTLLLLCVGLRIYKSDRAGISYDESLTFQRYAGSVKAALTSFDPASASSTNNHVLNSIFIHYAQKYFGSYEHFIRIPSLAAGIIFSLATAYIIYKTVRSRTIRIASLGMVLLLPYVFDYSYLARGYSFALAGVFATIAFVIWLMEHKIRFRYWLIPAVLISMMNFLAFGSMLSAMLVLAGLNAVFILLYSPKIFSDSPGKVKTIVANLVSISVLTSVPLFFLYRAIYKNILGSWAMVKINRGWKGWPSFVSYLHNLLVRKVFGTPDTVGLIILWVAVGLLAAGILIGIYKFCK